MSWKQRLKNTWLHPRYLSNQAKDVAITEFAQHAHGELLDVGCGIKPYQSVFMPNIESYTGLDVPWSMHGVQYIDVGGSSHQLPFATASFDTVLTTEVMEHVAEPDEMLAEIGRVLKPSGILVLSIPFHEPLHELPYDYFRFTHIALEYLMEKHGFSIKMTRRRGGVLLVIAHLLSSFLYRRYGSTGYPNTMKTKPIAGLLVISLCVIIQFVLGNLDRFINDPFDTLGFVILAKKMAVSNK